MPEAWFHLVLPESNLLSITPELRSLFKGFIHQVVGVTLQPWAADYGQYFRTTPLKKAQIISLCLKSLGSGGWIRTNDLWVMSPTSFHCSTPRRCFYIC